MISCWSQSPHEAWTLEKVAANGSQPTCTAKTAILERRTTAQGTSKRRNNRPDGRHCTQHHVPSTYSLRNPVSTNFHHAARPTPLPKRLPKSNLAKVNSCYRAHSRGKSLAFSCARSTVTSWAPGRPSIAFRALMDRSAGSCGGVRAILILLSFVALQVTIVSRAGASCGDWLAHSTRMSASTQVDSRSSGSSARQVATSYHSQSSSIPTPAPCRGPYCRSVPAQPVPPMPPNVVPHSNKLALVGRTILHKVDGCFSRVSDESLVHSMRGFPAGIERPPRA